MATYEYEAKDGVGNEFSGTYSDIENVAALRAELNKVGYSLVKASRTGVRKERLKRIRRSDVVAFAYRFAGMYAAGLSVIRCLETLEEQAHNKAFGAVITDVRRSVETGSSLRNAFAKHSNIFSEFFLGMVEAGETGGKLATALEMSAEYLEKQAELRHKVTSAFVYPAVVGAVCLLVVGGLLIFIVPVFSKLYVRLHVSLPAFTQALVSLSAVLKYWWWAILITVGAGVTVLRRLLEKPEVRARWDVLKLNMPVFGRLNRMVVVSHFTRTFAMLISVGVSLVRSLEVASAVAHNHRVSEITESLQQSIKAGNPVAKSMQAHDIFPAVIVQLATSGEEAGVLPEMLNKGADFLDRDIDRAVSALLVKLEPALTLLLGAVIGLVVMGIYMPIFDYMSHLSQ
ncbi:MAG: type II secretion system F family protein [Phycisphaerales bacterium]|nr:MAG: type II secretion system F family protein [Phycisphaerales bacterium]